MASPQLEDGYLKIANELYDALTLANLSKNQYKVALAVVRRTYGWRKKADVISNSQFAAMTDMQGTHAAAAVRELIAANVLTCHGKTGVGQVLGVNKNYTEWMGVWKSADAQLRVTKSVTPKGHADKEEAPESDDDVMTESVTPTEPVTAVCGVGDKICHEGVTESVTGGDEIRQGGVTDFVNTKDIIKNKERQSKDNIPHTPGSEGEAVVVDDCFAPQAASVCDDPQGDLLSENQNPGAQQAAVKAKPLADSETIAGIFGYWQKTMDKPRAKLDDKRRRSIRRALTCGYSPRDLCRAIQGCSLTPHNMGQNERGEKYVGLELILRNADQIDRFMANASAPPVSTVGMSKSALVTAANMGLGARLAANFGEQSEADDGGKVAGYTRGGWPIGKDGLPMSKAEVSAMKNDAAAAEFAANIAAKHGLNGAAPDADNVIDMGEVEQVAPVDVVTDPVDEVLHAEEVTPEVTPEELAAKRAANSAALRAALGGRLRSPESRTGA